MPAPITLLGGVHADHPGGYARTRGEKSTYHLAVTVGKSATLRQVPLDEADLIRLIQSGAQALDLIRRDREGDR